MKINNIYSVRFYFFLFFILRNNIQCQIRLRILDVNSHTHNMAYNYYCFIKAQAQSGDRLGPRFQVVQGHQMKWKEINQSTQFVLQDVATSREQSNPWSPANQNHLGVQKQEKNQRNQSQIQKDSQTERFEAVSVFSPQYFCTFVQLNYFLAVLEQRLKDLQLCSSPQIRNKTFWRSKVI